MDNSGPLVWYGILVLIVCAAAILVPYLRGKSDLLTAWNVLLIGLASYTGLGCLQVYYGEWNWAYLQWYQPTRQDISWYIVTSGAFMASLLLAYFYIPWGKKLAGRSLRTWPPFHAPTSLFVIAICGLIAAVSFTTMGITFVGPAMMKLSHKAIVFATVFAFMLWYQQRINLAWLLVFLGVFAIASIFAMLVSPGRRLLLSVFLGPVVAVYWLQARYWRPRFCLTMVTFAAVAIIAVSIVYSSFRWFSKPAGGKERTTANVVESVKQLRVRSDMFQSFFSNKLQYFSQWNVQYSLLAKRYVDMRELKPIPLNTLRFIVSYPIPRKIWGAKPVTLSIVLSHASGYTQTVWPAGPAGHAAYEGGLLAVMLYGFLLAMGARFLDEPMRAQPTNPFLISLQAAAMPHVLALPRGDLGTMTINVVECFLFAYIASVACRMLFGTARLPLGAPMLRTQQYAS